MSNVKTTVQAWSTFHTGCCGREMCVPDSTERHWRKTGKTFWCCYCGSRQLFNGGKTSDQAEIDRLRRHQNVLRQQRDAERAAKQAERNSHRATKGHLTRQRKRAANGVCPCCGRTFKQLSRHMKSQHPDFVEKHAHE